MAKKKTNQEKSPAKRTPEDSVKVALDKSKAKIEPGINGEIKDIVDDILKGNLKKVMNADVTDKVRKIGLKENEESLDEKELILGGKSEDDGAGHKVVKSDVTDVTKDGKQEGQSQMHEDEVTEDEVSESEVNEGEKTEEDDIEAKLAEMGYGLEEETEEEISTELPSDLDDETEIDLESVGFETFGEEEEAPVEEIPAEEAPVEEIPAEEAPVEEPETEITVKAMSYDELSDENKGEIDEFEKDINDIRSKLTNELETIGESVLPKEAQEKLTVYFEMLAEKKANVIAKKQVVSVINKTNDYMNYVVEEFVKEKENEIKEAVEASKKTEIYENFKYLVEKMYGENLTDIMEAKKSEEFLTNVISEMKNENEKLENQLTESKKELMEMECKVIFLEMTKDNTYTEKAKLAEFVETFDYETVGDFKKKVKLVKEQFENLKKDSKRPVATKQVKIDENKIVKAVKKNKLNKSKDIETDDEIDPDMFKSNLW